MSYKDTNEEDLDLLFNIYEKEKEKTKPIEKTECKHTETEKSKNVLICKKCGIEIFEMVDMDNKYNNEDNSKTIERISTRVTQKRNIYAILKTISFLDPETIEEINSKYCSLSQETHRGKKLKGIIFAITYETIKERQKEHTPEDIYNALGISHQVASQGKTMYLKSKSKAGKKITQHHIAIENYIIPILKKFDGNSHDLKQIQSIYSKIQNKSPLINSSEPQSICISIIYYYINQMKKIDINKFSRTVDLSVATINKLYNKISEIMEIESFKNKTL